MTQVLAYKNLKGGRREAGFSLIEMMLACAVLMVGIVSVVQLVPASLKLNVNNRLDTMATVIAQRELDQILSQPLSKPSFTDQDGNVVSLGGNSTGAAVVLLDSVPVIDFSQSASAVPAGFIIPNYTAPNDPNGATFEVRWAVIPETIGNRIVSKRIVVGCRQTNATQPILPVSLDSWVQRF